MTYGTTLGKHIMMVASANMYDVEIYNKNNNCMEVVAT